MRRIHGVVKHYDWGCPLSLPELLGRAPDGSPWAEYWLGTHHGGPASFAEGGYLHEEIGDLPYLVKFLSAAHPLSLQTHPSSEQAPAGFADENARDVPMDDPARLYRDPNAKPEILVALTSFDALCGFRPVDATIDLLDRIGGGAASLAEHLAMAGLSGTVEDLYRRRFDAEPVVAACATSDRAEAVLVNDMAGRYPGDPSAVVTLMLNRVHLDPGEAVYLTPGNLHAYLSGVGVEVMGCSDNVLRGGMTSKHVDVDELLRTLDWSPLATPTVQSEQVGDGLVRYPTPGAPFEIHRVHGGRKAVADGEGVWVCTGGPRRGHGYLLTAGEAASIDAASTWFWITSADDVVAP